MTSRPSPPPSLEAGARIGVAALSGVVDGAALARGLATLEATGFEVIRASNLESECGLFAGTEMERLAGLHQLAADPAIEAILFARGGHGVLRLLPDVDWELLAARPRWFVGYSDLTPFLAQVVDRLGWVALHGPLVALDPALETAEIESLLRAAGGAWPYEVRLEGTDGDWRGVEGPLAGGCLSLLSATLGTPWAVPTGESILFLEDTHEPLFRVDRMLQQLRLAGAFETVRGVVLGSFDNVGLPHEVSEVLQAVRDAAGPEVPVAWGCPSGHCRPNTSLALGAMASVAAERRRLVLGAERTG